MTQPLREETFEGAEDPWVIRVFISYARPGNEQQIEDMKRKLKWLAASLVSNPDLVDSNIELKVLYDLKDPDDEWEDTIRSMAETCDVAIILLDRPMRERMEREEEKAWILTNELVPIQERWREKDDLRLRVIPVVQEKGFSAKGVSRPRRKPVFDLFTREPTPNVLPEHLPPVKVKDEVDPKPALKKCEAELLKRVMKHAHDIVNIRKGRGYVPVPSLLNSFCERPIQEICVSGLWTAGSYDSCQTSTLVQIAAQSRMERHPRREEILERELANLARLKPKVVLQQGSGEQRTFRLNPELLGQPGASVGETDEEEGQSIDPLPPPPPPEEGREAFLSRCSSDTQRGLVDALWELGGGDALRKVSDLKEVARTAGTEYNYASKVIADLAGLEPPVVLREGSTKTRTFRLNPELLGRGEIVDSPRDLMSDIPKTVLKHCGTDAEKRVVRIVWSETLGSSEENDVVSHAQLIDEASKYLSRRDLYAAIDQLTNENPKVLGVHNRAVSKLYYITPELVV